MDRLIVANAQGRELGYLDFSVEVDLDLGDTNDFEFQIPLESWEKTDLDFKYLIYIPDTEYGGMIGDMETMTKTGMIKITGDTWRGMMAKKIIEPPTGSDYKIVSGELNEVLKSLIEPLFGGFFLASETDTGISVSSYQFDRYCTLLDGAEEMLASKGCRLELRYKKEEPGVPGWIEVQAVPAEDYSESKEYNQDNRINFTARDYRRGINHLICAGTGEGADRTVLHLYVQSDGSIGKKQFYKGVDERTALYSYSSQPDAEQLEKDGTKRLESLMDYREFDMTVDDVELAIGDTVTGRDYVTGILVQKPVVQKILKIQKDQMSVEYKLKGE